MKRIVFLFLMAVSLAAHGEDVLQVVPVKTTANVKYADNKYLEFSLTNTSNIANLQFDIMLPEGINLRTAAQYIVFEERAQIWDDDNEDWENLFTVSTNKLSSGYTRFVFTPSGKGTIAPGSGVFMKIPYKTDASLADGIYPLVMNNIRLDKSVTETIVVDYASSYFVIGDGLSTEGSIDLSGITGHLPSFVVTALNDAIASNTNLKTLNLSGVTSLGAELVVPEGAFWYTSNAAKLNRTFTSGVKCTLCLPFDISAAEAATMGTFYEFTSISSGTVVMTQNDGDLSANTPFIFEPASNLAGVSTSGATISFSVSPVTENAVSEFTFTGTFTPITWANPSGIYGFATAGHDGFTAGDFVLAAPGASIAPYRAYLAYTGEGTLNGSSTRGEEKLPASMPVIYLKSGDNAQTDIKTIDTQSMEYNEWIGIDGMRYSQKPTRKGIYVNNGRKVIVK